MKYILDVSAIAALMKGDVITKFHVGTQPADDLLVPHPVVAHFNQWLAKLDANAWPGASVHKRWEKAREILARCPWDERVSAELAELRRRHTATELELLIAAHAVAQGGAVVVGTAAAAARFARFSGLAVEHWGADRGRGKEPLLP